MEGKPEMQGKTIKTSDYVRLSNGHKRYIAEQVCKLAPGVMGVVKRTQERLGILKSQHAITDIEYAVMFTDVWECAVAAVSASITFANSWDSFVMAHNCRRSIGEDCPAYDEWEAAETIDDDKTVPEPAPSEEKGQ